MEGMQRALIVSIISRGWASALALFAVPLYVRFLGIEAFGVVGLFTSFSILVGFLDLGLGATLTRQLAGISAKKITLSDGRDLLRTFEVAYAVIALFIGLLVIFSSAPVAHYWVKAQALEQSEIGYALALAGVAIACQWPTILYSSGLAGIHKQAQLGISTMVFATIRVSLTLTIVWLVPNLTSFFLAQIASLLLQTLGTRLLLWRALELAKHRAQFHMAIIRSSVKFAGGMTGIAITSIVLTQTDKVILSKVLNLSDFGIYVIAGTLATGLYMLISPMFSVMYPRFSSLFHSGENTKLIDWYHISSQTMAALVIPVTLLIAVFSKEVLYVWSGDPVLSQQGSLVLALLVIGNGCNGIMNIPYALQLSSGWTKLAIWVNIGAIILLAPFIWWAAVNFGPIGGAAVWAVLNIFYIVLTPQIMHRRLLSTEKIAWYWTGVVLPALTCSATLLVLRQIPLTEISRLLVGFILLIYWVFAVTATLLFLPRLRGIIIHSLQLKFSQMSTRNNHG